MENVLREILRENPYFQEVDENRFIPEFLGLIINGVVVYNINWVDIVDHGLMFLNKEIDQPVASIVLDNLNSLMIVTSDGIKDVL